ncbi:MAG: hypothetical protein JXJ19_03910 [Elusimicrobia bacterium]|nr:hypothetical protein [Elusimicrobiota bacterium]
MRKVLSPALILMICAAGLAAAPKVTPVANISLYGGQYYLDSEPSAFGGNADIYYSPVVNFTREDILVPVLNINYNGTRDVKDLVGGGTLTRQTFDAGATVKYVHSFGDTKAKTRVGYKKSFINEAKDEKWNEGLFDYERLLGGLTVQTPFLRHSFSLSCDYYIVTFPNYASLIFEDEYESSIDTQTYSELSENAGEDVLDYSNLAVTFEASRDYTGSFSAFYYYQIDLRDYKDQTVVDDDGSFLKEKRADIVNSLSAGLNYRMNSMALRLENETRCSKSNQNSYDASSTRFNKDFYSYYSSEFTPSVIFYLGSARPSKLRFWWDIEFKKYLERLAQDEEADYLDDKVSQTDNGFGVSYQYPVYRNLSVTAQLNRRTMSSNMKYEANYKYNYTVSNYYLGLNWRFGAN